MVMVCITVSFPAIFIGIFWNSHKYSASYQFFLFTLPHLIGDLSGLISERDYVKKIALLGRSSQDTPIKDVYTSKANLITASIDDSVDTCMALMMTKGVRHLPILDGDAVVGSEDCVPG